MIVSNKMQTNDKKELLTIRLSASHMQITNVEFFKIAIGDDSSVANIPGLTVLSTNSSSLHFAAAMKYIVLITNSDIV